MENEKKLFRTTVFLFLPVFVASPNCSEYGVCVQYVPAPPGQVPKCAMPGTTYCEQVDLYPQQLIMYLIQKIGYDFTTLLNDESTDDFVYRPNYRKPTAENQYYYRGPPPVIQPALSYGPLTLNMTNQPIQEGYPDRRYKIDPHILTNALQQPPGYNPQGQFSNGHPGGGYFYSPPISPPYYQQDFHSVQWWKRYKRSKDSQTRKKRQNSPGSETQLCPTTTNFIMPKAALNTKGSWMYTVNLNEIDNRYTQLVRSETCITDQCNGLCSLPNGYTSRCQQKYVQKRLVALEGGGDRLYSDTFWFPHCCVCQITSN